MTREEAIKILKIKKECFDLEGFSCEKKNHSCEECQNAIDMAIDALEAYKTKTIKYYDEDEQMWKIGEVIINE